MRTLHETWREATSALEACGIESPQLDARLLISHALHLHRNDWLTPHERHINAAEITAVTKLVERRKLREPVSRIIGEREFWSLPFGLNEATLDPRPDSETLVEAVLQELRQPDQPLSILDLGTGTGCLLLSLLHELPQAKGVGIDASPRAVEQAITNAERLNLSTRSTFLLGNWTQGITGIFDCIISNPPYIPTNDIAGLMPDVRLYDPLLALDGGNDGLAPYRTITEDAPRILRQGGLLAFEVGFGQAPDIFMLMAQHHFTNLKIRNDLNDVERCVMGRMPEA